jgi:hypothetical protein
MTFDTIQFIPRILQWSVYLILRFLKTPCIFLYDVTIDLFASTITTDERIIWFSRTVLVQEKKQNIIIVYYSSLSNLRRPHHNLSYFIISKDKAHNRRLIQQLLKNPHVSAVKWENSSYLPCLCNWTGKNGADFLVDGDGSFGRILEIKSVCNTIA